MGIDSIKKSSRFLQGRRYTHDTYTDAQEAFTSVLDLNANEIYTDQILIPSSSLPSKPLVMKSSKTNIFTDEPSIDFLAVSKNLLY